MNFFTVSCQLKWCIAGECVQRKKEAKQKQQIKTESDDIIGFWGQEF